MLALVYDIHGNLPALDAVLADARAEGADRWLLGGDVAALGAWPVETVERLRGLDQATWIRGNHERWLVDRHELGADDPMHAADVACRAALGDALADELAALPERAELGSELVAVHASPVSDVRSFGSQASDDDADLLGDVRAGRLVFGHTHIAFARRAEAVELVNPGSVGLPLDGDHRAAYALVGDDGALAHRRVAYDHEASAVELERRFGDAPWVRITCAWLRAARSAP